MPTGFGRYGFFLYDQTGEEQYRTWIERNAEWLKNSPQSENGVFGCVEDSSKHIRQCDVCGVSILYGI